MTYRYRQKVAHGIVATFMYYLHIEFFILEFLEFVYLKLTKSYVSKIHTPLQCTNFKHLACTRTHDLLLQMCIR
jgi:ATP sulfurylase